VGDTKYKREVEILVSQIVVFAEVGLGEFERSVISQNRRS
jgi:hypothetical protein